MIFGKNHNCYKSNSATGKPNFIEINCSVIEKLNIKFYTT